MAIQYIVILLRIIGSVVCVSDIDLKVPEAVTLGGTAVLGCKWSLETGETLYTVKWYHGAQEFFRFVPKEIPNTMVFSESGINVDVSRSGAYQVVLIHAQRSQSGRYRCEVSADAPFFHTVHKSSVLHVVEVPESVPVVQAQKKWYSIGDMVKANCSSSPSDPPANLTWLLNGVETTGITVTKENEIKNKKKSTSIVGDANTIIFNPWNSLAVTKPPAAKSDSRTRKKDSETTYSNEEFNSGQYQKDLFNTSGKFLSYNNSSNKFEESKKYDSFSKIFIRVQTKSFSKGQMNLTCVANIMNVWSASSSLLLKEEIPYIAPMVGTKESNLGVRCKGSIVSLLLSIVICKLTFVITFHTLMRC